MTSTFNRHYGKAQVKVWFFGDVAKSWLGTDATMMSTDERSKVQLFGHGPLIVFAVQHNQKYL